MPWPLSLAVPPHLPKGPNRPLHLLGGGTGGWTSGIPVPGILGFKGAQAFKDLSGNTPSGWVGTTSFEKSFSAAQEAGLRGGGGCSSIFFFQ